MRKWDIELSFETCDLGQLIPGTVQGLLHARAAAGRKAMHHNAKQTY